MLVEDICRLLFGGVDGSTSSRVEVEDNRLPIRFLVLSLASVVKSSSSDEDAISGLTGIKREKRRKIKHITQINYISGDDY